MVSALGSKQAGPLLAKYERTNEGVGNTAEENSNLLNPNVPVAINSGLQQ